MSEPTQTPYQPPPEWAQELIVSNNQIKKQQSDILDLLKGKILNPHDKGLLGDFQELRSDVAYLKKWKDRVLYMAIGAGAFGGSGLTIFITKIFKS